MTDYEDDDYEDDLDLSTLPDDELVEQMHDDLYNGLKEEIAEGTEILLERGWDANKVLNEALVAGMTIVGIDFRDGILFVPEVLMSANAMKAGMAILQPLLTAAGGDTSAGTIVIGTVKGDLHDIGKNLVGMMAEGAGFTVVDLGTNTDADEFIAAVREHDADILGMSALLTTTMVYMKTVVDEMAATGLGRVPICIGGAPISQGFADEIFRVFAARNPEIKINVENANPVVAAMLRHVGA